MRTRLAAAMLLGLGLSGAQAQVFLEPQATYTSPYYMNKNFAVSWGYYAINLAAAQKLNLTGRGVAVAVFDTGVNASNPKLAGNLLPGWNMWANNGRGGAGVKTDSGYHGTFVSGIIAANTSGTSMTVYGVAPQAKIMPIQIFDSRGYAAWTDGQLATAITYATINGARVFNNSWNSSQTLADLGVNAFSLNGTMGLQIAAWKQAANKGVLNVWAAGNYGRTDPGFYAALPAVIPQLASSWIVAVATDQTGQLASYSNACGITAAYCLAAPGSNIISIYKDTLGVGSGTSFTAPMVSGAITLMMQYWPSLSSQQIRTILFATANKTGIYANSSIYGQGLMDLTRAFQPLGPIKLATTSTVNGPNVPVAGSYVLTSNAFGNALSQGLSNRNMMVLDDFNRDYRMSMGAGMVAGDRINQWGDQLAMFGSDERRDGKSTISVGSGNGIRSMFGYTESGSIGAAMGSNVSPSLAYGAFAQGSVRGSDLVLLNSVGNPYMNLAPNGVSTAVTYKDGDRFTRVGAFTNTVPADTLSISQVNLPRMAGGAIEHGARWEGGYLTASLGMVSESGSVLGARSGGAFSAGRNATTMFASVDGGLDMARGFRMFAGATIGYSMVSSAPDSVITKVNGLISSNAYAGVSKTGVFGDADRAGIVVGLPMRINAGQVSLRLPMERDIDGNVSFQDAKVSIRNSKLEWTAQAFYNTDIGANQSLGFGLGARFNPVDTAGGKPEVIGMARYRLRF